MGLALFDLDRTLIDVNSGRLWVSSEWRAGRLSALDVIWASWWLARYSLGWESGLERVFEAAAAGLEGVPEGEIADRVQNFLDRDLRHRLRPGGEKALEHHRSQGDKLVLATSGTQFAARSAVEAFGLQTFVCTELEILDGRFTGRIAALAVGDAKLHRCEAWAEANGHDLSQATFYSDSMTDVALLERVAHPVVVNPDRRLRWHAQQRGWPIEDWGQAADGAR
ncbi:MAG: HAD family phosphatase [Myxococcota bacterium]